MERGETGKVKLTFATLPNMKKSIFKSDPYRKARGGYSRLLQVSCEKCKAMICFYQKDGPGMLKRMYVDRMMESRVSLNNKNLACPSCKETLGMQIIYKKERRLAYRLFAGSVLKTIVNSSRI